MGSLGSGFGGGKGVTGIVQQVRDANKQGSTPAIPDLTDKAIQMARERERRRQMSGGTASTFLSGVLGPQGTPSTFVKSLYGS